MIHVVIGTGHVSAILGYAGATVTPSFERLDASHTELRQRLGPLLGQPILPPRSRDDLATVTVFEVLRAFHERAWDYLRNPSPVKILVKLQRELRSFARRDYHYPEFEATLEDAYHYLAINGPSSHGSVRLDGHQAPVFLPDFSVAVRHFGFFAEPPEARRWAKQRGNAQESISLLNEVGSLADSRAALTLRRSLRGLRAGLPGRDEFAPLLSAVDSALSEVESGVLSGVERLLRLLNEAVEWMEAQAHRANEIRYGVGDQ